MTTNWWRPVWQWTVILTYWSYRATRLLAWAIARILITLLPPPATAAGAGGRSLGIGGVLAALLILPALLAGEPTLLFFAVVFGLTLGGLVAWGLGQHGRAQLAVAGGALALGNRRGALGLPAVHTMPRAARVRHVAVYGATGSGKSTILRNLVTQDAAAPERPGLLCVDIKDDLVTQIAAGLPPGRVGDVLLFDPADTDFPPAFNPLAGVPPQQRTLAAAELVAALKRLFADSWGPRLEHVLRMVVLTLLETPDATLLDIARILTDDRYRTWALSHLTNFSVQAFWQHEFPAIAGKGSVANVASILNKLGVFTYPEIRNVVGQTQRGLDLRAAMDAGQIVLAHLPQGVLGEDAAHFLAALLVGKAQLAAQSRVTLPHAQRKTFYMFVDEFQNYETSAFTKLITEGRSMGVGVVAACQFREQLNPHLRLALDHNCAYALVCRFARGKHIVQVEKLQEPDGADAAVLIRALPPPPAGAHGQLAAIRARSRQALAQPRAVVEAAITGRMSGTMTLGQSPGTAPRPTARVVATQTVTTQTTVTMHTAMPVPPLPPPAPARTRRVTKL